MQHLWDTLEGPAVSGVCSPMSSQHDPYVLGDTHATMAGTEGSQAARRSESQKPGLSSDRGLQLARVKPESLVTAGQQYRGEYVPGPCTHRPSRI